MIEGLLWFDDDPFRDLAHKIALAAARYRKKFGAPPNVCYVHPSASPVERVGGVEVKPLPTVLVHHFWIGCEVLCSEPYAGRNVGDTGQLMLL